MQRICSRLTIVLASLALLFSLGTFAAPAFATSASQLQGGVDAAANQSGSSEAVSTVNNTITSVINIFSVFVGIIAVIMIIVGGYRYITSGGDSTKVTSAKNTLLYAIIGLVIVALAQVIAQFVLNKATTNTTSASSSSSVSSPNNSGSPSQSPGTCPPGVEDCSQ